jgi:hypothetical protein
VGREVGGGGRIEMETRSSDRHALQTISMNRYSIHHPPLRWFCAACMSSAMRFAVVVCAPFFALRWLAVYKNNFEFLRSKFLIPKWCNGTGRGMHCMNYSSHDWRADNLYSSTRFLYDLRRRTFSSTMSMSFRLFPVRPSCTNPVISIWCYNTLAVVDRNAAVTSLRAL